MLAGHFSRLTASIDLLHTCSTCSELPCNINSMAGVTAFLPINLFQAIVHRGGVHEVHAGISELES